MDKRLMDGRELPMMLRVTQGPGQRVEGNSYIDGKLLHPGVRNIESQILKGIGIRSVVEMFGQSHRRLSRRRVSVFLRRLF